MPKTGYLKGHKEYAGAYKGLKGTSYPKTVTNSPVPVPSPSFKASGTRKRMKKKSHNPGY